MVRLMSMLRKLFACLSLSFVFLLVGCVSLARPELSAEEESSLYPLASYVPEVFEWKEVCPGVSRFDFENTEIPLIYHAVKIDLSSAGPGGTLELVCEQGQGTAKFAARKECAVAVNATPFTGSGQLVGIHKVAGELVSQPVARYAAIGFREELSTERGRAGGDSGDVRYRRGYTARIFTSQADSELEEWSYAFGGFFVVLKNGEVRTEFIRRGDSRSGAGLSADGRTLYLLVVEGERPSKSRGLSYPQCGEIFRAMGCYDALEFDGGSSAELCINGQSVMSYHVHHVQKNSFGFKLAK